MPSGSAERGFTYLAMLLAVAVIGIGLAVAGQSWSTAAQREMEAQLLFAGGQFRRAIALYYENTPGAAPRYPRRLEDLLEDRRFPVVRRYLRRIYLDPMTGSREWGLIEAPGGGIMGVHSRSDAGVLKSANFSAADKALEGKTRYSEWKFFYAPVATVATPAVPAAPTK